MFWRGCIFTHGRRLAKPTAGERLYRPAAAGQPEMQLSAYRSTTQDSTRSIVSLISPTWGWTSQIRSCSARDNSSIRHVCSRSSVSIASCLAEMRRIHQKQTTQHAAETIVSQNRMSSRLIRGRIPSQPAEIVSDVADDSRNEQHAQYPADGGGCSLRQWRCWLSRR
jgi:hypothetical protein